MPLRLTERGFADYADFKDTYGAHVVMRESSADPLDRLWIFVTGGNLKNGASMYLNVEQATLLIAGLQEWVAKQEEMGPPRGNVE